MSFFDFGFSTPSSGGISDLLKQYYQQGRGDIQQGFQHALGYEQPYMQAGQQALGSYLGTLGLGNRQDAINRFKASPGYQFALQQGTQAVQRGEAARGLAGSGAEQKQLAQYGQGLANQEYGQYQSKLAGLAGMGQQAATTAGGWSMGAGSGLAQLGLGYGGQQASYDEAMQRLKLEEEQAKQQASSSFWGGIGSLAGSVAGFFI